MNFSKYNITKSINSLQNGIAELERQINEYDNLLCQFSKTRNESIHKLAYLKIRQEDDSDDERFKEFVDLLYDKFSNIEVKGDSIHFYNTASLSYVKGKDFIEDILKSSASSGYSQHLKALLKAIFVDEIVDMRMCSKYYINFSNDSVDTELRGATIPDELSNCMPNPHHWNYNCLGENRNRAKLLAVDGNYYDVLTTLLFATGTINLEEEPTFNRLRSAFNNRINSSSDTCRCFVFVDDDNTKEENYLTANQVLSRLKEKGGYYEADEVVN